MHALNSLSMANAQEVDEAMGVYGSTYDEPTRNIAELINAVPNDAAPWVKETLNECAKLYADRHGLNDSEIAAASAAHAAWEQAFNDLRAKERIQ